MTRSRIPPFVARLVRERAGNTCEYCRLPQESQEAEFHLDHVVPRTAGGQDEPENLALACVGCSLHKNARLSGPVTLGMQSVRLFNPRRDQWHDHFQWDREWKIRGRTAIGRATIAALSLNRQRLVHIRQELAALGHFPPSR